MKLADLLGLREDAAMADYEQMDSEGSAEELGEEWVGSGEPPDHHVDSAGKYKDSRLHCRKRHSSRPPSTDNLAAIEQLVAAGMDVNEIPGGYQVAALTMAAAYGTPPTIRGLVDLGADLHRKGNEGPVADSFRHASRED